MTDTQFFRPQISDSEFVEIKLPGEHKCGKKYMCHYMYFRTKNEDTNSQIRHML